MCTMIEMAVIVIIFMLLSCGSQTDDTDTGMNVLLIIIDTLRADHLGFWGYERDITPSLDSLALSGTAWMEMQAQSSWTLPSVASILTGLSPREHGAGISYGRMYGMATSIPNLQGILHSNGWQTCAIFNVIFLNENFGFHRGFDHFDCRGVAENTGCRRADQTVDDALEWLNDLDAETSFFMVLHFYDPHIPYDPPPPYDTLYADPSYTAFLDGQQQLNVMNAVNRDGDEIDDEGLNNLIDLYDGEIAFTDAQIGRLLCEIRNKELADSTLVIVVADHGEEFLEHSGIEHGRTLYQEVTHVPMILSGPGVTAGRAIDVPAAHIDILPTILSHLQLAVPEGLTGRNLLAAEYSELDIPASNLLWSEYPQASIRRDDLKIIWNADGSGIEYYDLAQDPREQAPLQDPDILMVEAVEFYWATPPAAEAPYVSFGDAERNQLRDLGYIR
ncbi:MAG: sulfatase [Candidatus Aegiribacteria sp.]|nr:sulfatase [Candidatus Aegiribacteria sp.]